MGFKKQIVIREVWEHNLEFEFVLIESIIDYYPYVSIDTEFPGIIHEPHLGKHAQLTHSNKYSLLKTNVDDLNMIQLGLTFSDSVGNLPDFGFDTCFIWQFTFREFDIFVDPQNPKSIELLMQQGIDFLTSRTFGVCSKHFSELFWNCFRPRRNLLTWVAFHSAYDFGYMIKVLTQSELPSELNSFMCLLWNIFGVRLYDMKYMMWNCRLRGGLEKMAQSLDVGRIAGKQHQAGSDSLLTMQTFMKMKDVYFHGENSTILNQYISIPYGLNIKIGSDGLFV